MAYAFDTSVAPPFFIFVSILRVFKILLAWGKRFMFINCKKSYLTLNYIVFLTISECFLYTKYCTHCFTNITSSHPEAKFNVVSYGNMQKWITRPSSLRNPSSLHSAWWFLTWPSICSDKNKTLHLMKYDPVKNWTLPICC